MAFMTWRNEILHKLCEGWRLIPYLVAFHVLHGPTGLPAAHLVLNFFALSWLQRGYKVKAVARPRSSKALEGYGPNLEVRFVGQ